MVYILRKNSIRITTMPVDGEKGYQSPKHIDMPGVIEKTGASNFRNFIDTLRQRTHSKALKGEFVTTELTSGVGKVGGRELVMTGRKKQGGKPGQIDNNQTIIGHYTDSSE